ncbi:hypothetical protein ABEB36_001161 [Hypothenemus hampei]|uniref:Uncharacterized protein n=1 Tax=Hypothenemus hampei TaxID=57062 RepID=A0ABD1FDP8_HYPHA
MTGPRWDGHQTHLDIKRGPLNIPDFGPCDSTLFLLLERVLVEIMTSTFKRKQKRYFDDKSSMMVAECRFVYTRWAFYLFENLEATQEAVKQRQNDLVDVIEFLNTLTVGQDVTIPLEVFIIYEAAVIKIEFPLNVYFLRAEVCIVYLFEKFAPSQEGPST